MHGVVTHQSSAIDYASGKRKMPEQRLVASTPLQPVQKPQPPLQLGEMQELFLFLEKFSKHEELPAHTDNLAARYLIDLVLPAGHERTAQLILFYTEPRHRPLRTAEVWKAIAKAVLRLLQGP